VNCSMWNVQSMVNKTPKLMEHLMDRDPGIVFISETWLMSDSNDITALLKSYGYKLVHDKRKNRAKETGGGVGILLKLGMKHKHIHIKPYSSFELTMVKLFCDRGKPLLLVCVYRLLFISVKTFLDEIVKLFEVLASSPEEVILAGDINIHMDVDNAYSTRFNDILNSFNFIQYIDFPTHKLGHTLDIVATFDGGLYLSGFVSNQYDVSDHFLVDFHLQFAPEVKNEREISYRNSKCMDTVKFESDLVERLHLSDTLSFGDNILRYNETLSNVLNEHAPIKTKAIKILLDAPWFDSEYVNLRRLRRKAEVQYKKTGSVVHKENYVSLRKQCTDLAHKKKCRYYGDKLDGANNKILYSEINRLLDKKQELVLPDSKSDGELANSFINYFTEKIEKIRSTFPVDGVQSSSSFVQSSSSFDGSTEKLSTFECVTNDEIRQIVLSYGVKCSPDDPIPANILTNHLDTFVPIWSKLVNLSLREGSMDCLKNAVLLPLIKEMDEQMDKDSLKNYRPVSNLLFVGKLIERIVAVRLNNHMTENNLHSDFQYGYKKGHSTETLLLKVVNDLLISCDNNMPCILMLLDLSAAFDTVDQDKLLTILQNEIGIEGTALKWFASFLRNRTQKVKIGNSYSAEVPLKYGVAQGSVLGPDLFNIYIRSLCKYLKPSHFSIFGFADDHQLLKSFLPILQVHALGENIQHCFKMIAEWMNEFFLRLNGSKTKIFIVMPPSLAHTICIRGTFIDESCVRFVHSAKNLGVVLDEELTFELQIVKVVKSCFFSIRNLSRIKHFLTFEQLRTAICACVFSKLDYCNSLYYGVNQHLIDKLQSVQNSAARLLRKKAGINNNDFTISQYINKCHWLRVRERITFKICLLVHKSLCGAAPQSLQKLFVYNTSERTLKLIQYPFKSSYGKRSFSRIGPRIWNLLPANLREEQDTPKFKTSLKTFLFERNEHFMLKLHEV
jgi:hypothetical protein